ncbi:hypothetical protein [Candidatus Methylacidithermus pantelleriae]|uniref:hypothetical protein n=1 Tax=Candidatus Methylacidithermus pantelleriae TaxID=2744239 RepID=UPI00157D33F1|nr:hypothetical protein [Candidatus Methylacidithermus pantelleriae]
MAKSEGQAKATFAHPRNKIARALCSISQGACDRTRWDLRKRKLKLGVGGSRSGSLSSFAHANAVAMAKSAFFLPESS